VLRSQLWFDRCDPVGSSPGAVNRTTISYTTRASEESFPAPGRTVRPCSALRAVPQRELPCVLHGSQKLLVDMVSILMWAAGIVGGLLAAYLVLHYVLFLLMAHPKDAGDYGLGLNEFERRQLVEWVPRQEDFLKHDDEDRTYDDVFGTYRDIDMSYTTCVFPRAPFSNDNEVENRLLEPKEGMRILELGCGAGATAHDFASRHNVKIVCATNSGSGGRCSRPQRPVQTGSRRRWPRTKPSGPRARSLSRHAQNAHA
jgi:hypothetical protein